jgi:ribosomal protein S18 acetylase RimI-like enzyme
MERVEHQAALDGKELTLEVWTVNQRAAGLGFYERRGFSIDGKTDGSNAGLEKLLMRKAR